MHFNDSTNKELSLYHDALFLTGAKSTTFDIVDFTRSANFALDAYVRKVFQLSGRWQYDDPNHVDGNGNPTMPIGTTDLMAGQDNITLADEHLRISRVRIIDKHGNWKTLEPIDRRDETDEQLAATGEPCVYDKLGRSILPLPIPDYSVTKGVEVTFERGSNYFTPTDTTKTPGIASPFHRYISLLPSQDQPGVSVDRQQIITNNLKELDADLVQFIAYQDRDEKPKFTVRPPLEIY